MGICCTQQKEQTPTRITVTAPTSAAKSPQHSPTTSCSTANCCVTSDLKEFCFLFKSLQTSDETTNKMAAYFEHYLMEHAANDAADRLKNECRDSECEYEEEYKSQFRLNNRQQLHGYFYHYHKYRELKQERQQSLHFMHIATSVCVQTTLRTRDIIGDEAENEYTSFLNEGATNRTSVYLSQTSTTSPVEGNLSVQISRLLSPLAPDANTSPIADNEELSQSLTNHPALISAVTARDDFFCEQQADCDRVKMLLMFSQNVDPQQVRAQQAELYTNEYIERIKSYWDHYSEAHIENYVKRDCIHMKNKNNLDDDEKYDDDDDDDLLCEYLSRTINVDNIWHQFQLLLHRHFYHCNIMKEENNRIKYVKETMHGQKVIDKFKPTLQTILASQSNLNMNNVLQFGFEWQCSSEMARFANPKQEILKNKYVPVEKSAWNDLLKHINGAAGLLSCARTKLAGLKMKELIALKLYTDFDALQKVYRRAYHAEDDDERVAIQSEFYHWNSLLSRAVSKSRDIITQTLYHGIDCVVSVPTFCGKYHGPISCTKLFAVANGFAGDDGSILEIYPSFGRKGIDVSWISKYPDEQEVLYFDATFSIKQIINNNSLRAANNNSLPSILKALQTINVESTILSFNEIDDGDDDLNDVETFDGLSGSELMSIFYLLYIQYKPQEWAQLVASCDEDIHRQVALAQYRDQFAQLTQNVTTIRMESASQLIQYFFSCNLDCNCFDDDNIKHIISHTQNYANVAYNVRFETIIKLFPKCKQISISGNNFDWSLADFVSFLKKYNLDFSGIQLQDIFIRFNEDNKNKMAKKRLKHSAREDFVSELAKLGWRFVTASHLHRFGFEPQAEKPYLILFMNEGRVFARSYSKRIIGNAPKLVRATTTSLMSSSCDNYMSSSCSSNNIEGDHAIVDYNPKHLFLSKTVLNECHYREKLIAMLENRKKGLLHTQFDQISRCVETLILYPIDKQLSDIFYIKRDLQLNIVEFMFPNVSDIYLRETTFNPKVCDQLIQFIKKSKPSQLKRIFYSVNKACADRDVAKLKLRLNVYKWDFSQIEQVAFKIST